LSWGLRQAPVRLIATVGLASDSPDVGSGSSRFLGTVGCDDGCPGLGPPERQRPGIGGHVVQPYHDRGSGDVRRSAWANPDHRAIAGGRSLLVLYKIWPGASGSASSAAVHDFEVAVIGEGVAARPTQARPLRLGPGMRAAHEPWCDAQCRESWLSDDLSHERPNRSSEPDTAGQSLKQLILRRPESSAAGQAMALTWDCEFV
jgi:hypothetical protein